TCLGKSAASTMRGCSRLFGEGGRGLSRARSPIEIALLRRATRSSIPIEWGAVHLVSGRGAKWRETTRSHCQDKRRIDLGLEFRKPAPALALLDLFDGTPLAFSIPEFHSRGKNSRTALWTGLLMATARTDNPLVVQSDHTLLLEVDHALAEA